MTYKKYIFQALEFIRREPIFKCLAELERNQEKSDAAIQTIQHDKLRSVLQSSIKHVPFYKNYSSLAGGKLPAEELVDQFPILQKKEINANKNALINANFKNRLYHVKTSGSTGNPLKFYKDRVATAYTYAAMYRGHKWHGVSCCDKEAYLWGIPIGKKNYIAAKTKDYILNRFREKAFNISDDVCYDFYDKLLKHQPVFLTGYGSLIYEFARFVNHNNLDFDGRLRFIKYTAEMMPDYQRKFTQDVFGCPVVSEYGLAECGIVTFQCPKGGNHILSDCVYPEFIKEDETGLYRIIVTNLNAYGFPMIRYDTGDLAQSNRVGVCECTLPLPVMGDIVGRSSDIVVTPEQKKIHSNIFSYIIKQLLHKYNDIGQLRFTQNKIDHLLVEVSKRDSYTNQDFIDDIVGLIHGHVSPKIDLKIVHSPQLSREASGKLRYFISHIADSND